MGSQFRLLGATCCLHLEIQGFRYRLPAMAVDVGLSRATLVCTHLWGCFWPMVIQLGVTAQGDTANLWIASSATDRLGSPAPGLEGHLSPGPLGYLERVWAGHSPTGLGSSRLEEGVLKKKKYIYI